MKNIEIKSRNELRQWLKLHHKQSESIWLVLYKKHIPKKYVSYESVVEEALCFGWIDSRPNKLDVDRYKLLLSPRKSESAWSAVNKKRVEILIKKGLMHPAGLKKVAEAKKNGRWKALESSDKLKIPAELAIQFKKSKKAFHFFNELPPSSKKIILEWINSAKTDLTRTQRINKTIVLSEQGIRANHYRQPKK